MWNVLVFIVLIVLVKRRIFKGQIALTYAVMYGAGRFYLEGLRTDQLQIGNTGLAVSQLVGLSCAVVGIAIYVFVLIKKKPTKISEENIQD